MMTAIVFNGTKIYMDTDMELHVIRGDLHIDTKSFKALPKARSVTKRVKTGRKTSVLGTLRDANLKVGKSMQIKANVKNTVGSALTYLGMKGKVSKTGKAGVFMVTRTA